MTIREPRDILINRLLVNASRAILNLIKDNRRHLAIQTKDIDRIRSGPEFKCHRWNVFYLTSANILHGNYFFGFMILFVTTIILLLLSSMHNIGTSPEYHKKLDMRSKVTLTHFLLISILY